MDKSLPLPLFLCEWLLVNLRDKAENRCLNGYLYVIYKQSLTLNSLFALRYWQYFVVFSFILNFVFDPVISVASWTKYWISIILFWLIDIMEGDCTSPILKKMTLCKEQICVFNSFCQCFFSRKSQKESLMLSRNFFISLWSKG